MYIAVYWPHPERKGQKTTITFIQRWKKVVASSGVCLVIPRLGLGHHHFTELVEIHGAGSILVQFLNDSFELLISQGSKQFTNQGPQGLGCDEALALLVVDPEGVLQFLLHRLHVRVLDQEGGTQLAELTEFNLSRAILVNLVQKFSQLLLRRPESHRPHDVTKVVSREELLLLGVKQVEADLQTPDFIVGQIGLLIDLLKVNISVGVSFASHD